MHTPGVVGGGAREQYDATSLLAVAVRTFNDSGYDGTSMSAVAAAAGISKSSIYHHFTSKEQLLNLAVSRALNSLFQAWRNRRRWRERPSPGSIT